MVQMYISHLEIANNANDADINTGFGKLTVGTNVITVDWIKEYNNTAYSFINTGLAVDEFKEFYISATARLNLMILLKIVSGLVKLMLMGISSGTIDM